MIHGSLCSVKAIKIVDKFWRDQQTEAFINKLWIQIFRVAFHLKLDQYTPCILIETVQISSVMMQPFARVAYLVPSILIKK